jgi:PPK2 family polyphosphate:nucleotide phosphotransferase
VTASIRDLFRARVTDQRFSLATVQTTPLHGMSRKKTEKVTADDQRKLARWQEQLAAEDKRSLLIVVQGVDTAGKDGMIKHVFASMNPAGCTMTAFKEPTPRELAHNFLWRIRNALPLPGQVGVFNRSHYEDVLIVRVDNLVPEEVWRPRYTMINSFEKGLVKAGTTIVKIFLHISFEEQRLRLLKRLDSPSKRWKFEPGDVRKRGQWGAYMEAYSEAIARCSTDAAPWYVVPADAKWYRNWVVGRLLVETFEQMNPNYPRPHLDIAAYKARLKAPSSSAR